MIHTPHTSHDEGLLGATMCHGSLCDLYQHCKHGFLWGTDKVRTTEGILVLFYYVKAPPDPTFSPGILSHYLQRET